MFLGHEGGWRSGSLGHGAGWQSSCVLSRCVAISSLGPLLRLFSVAVVGLFYASGLGLLSLLSIYLQL